jgi:hypothetical protein
MTITNEQYHADPAVSAITPARSQQVALPLLEPLPRPQPQASRADCCNADWQLGALRRTGAR